MKWRWKLFFTLLFSFYFIAPFPSSTYMSIFLKTIRNVSISLIRDTQWRWWLSLYGVYKMSSIQWHCQSKALINKGQVEWIIKEKSRKLLTNLCIIFIGKDWTSLFPRIYLERRKTTKDVSNFQIEGKQHEQCVFACGMCFEPPLLCSPKCYWFWIFLGNMCNASGLRLKVSSDWWEYSSYSIS